MGLEIWVKAVQPAPWQRSTRYSVTPTSSVLAVHESVICELETAVALRPVGVEGGVVSGGGGVAVLQVMPATSGRVVVSLQGARPP